MAKDFLENLFESIDLIVTNKLGDLSYDKTEQCTIIEVKGNKEYYVSNGAAKYVAYAQKDAEYKEGDSVYVTIPQGNYDNQKLIIGKHNNSNSTATSWISPMENFVNVTGNICSNTLSKDETGLVINSNSHQAIQLWADTSNRTYTQYDRLCLTGDFSTQFSDIIIDGSYGLLLTGTIKDTRLDKELKEIDKQIKAIYDNDEYSAEVKKEKLAELNKKAQYARDKYKINGEKEFMCFFDAKDMLGNPYDFSVPFRQEKLIEVEPTSEISNLALYFYQGLSDDKTWNPTFIDVNNELVEVDQNQKVFVENVSVNFGYSFESYKEDTAVLYTLDSQEFAEGEAANGARKLQLRWVHYDDNQTPRSIRDINDDALKYHFTKVHWYKYRIDDTKTEPDKLAGYFWEEMTEYEDKFECNIRLNLPWQEEKFKVIIQFDDKIIRSKELVFDNPSGSIQYGKIVTGLKITFPSDDNYKGTFYIYGDDYNASFSTERTFDLIAEYETIDSTGQKIWDDTDVICWKFPADYTMLHIPEDEFEYNTSKGDVFLSANVEEVESTVVNGIKFETDRSYHQIIRKIQVNRIKDEDGKELSADSLESRTQKYRVNGMFNGGTNNTVECYVYKPEVDVISAKVDFTFGLHTTNGTKYTLAVSWVEKTNDNKTYHRPPAITLGETKEWEFSIKILDSTQKEIKPADEDRGWDFTLSWHEDRIYYPTDQNKKITDIFTLSGKKLTVNIKDNNFNNYINNAQYQILKIAVKDRKTSPQRGFDYALTTFLPIPIRSTRDILGIDGPDRIYYDNAGYNPRWNDQYYKLIWKSGVEKIENSDWGIKDTEVNTSPTQKPQIEVKDGNFYLRAPDTYLPPSSGKYDGVATFTKNKNDDTKILWVQPIFVTMDAYGSQFFNQWDGKMKIDEENGVIMSSVIGAGKKNSDNSYSGVVLGEVNKILDKDKKEINDSANTGILGFDKGIQSFGFKNDGTAFIGKSGMGQIKFNGTKGTIQSGNYEEIQDPSDTSKKTTGSGMLIDLDDSKIRTPRLWINAGKDGDSSFYLKIADNYWNGDSYLRVAKDGVKMGKWDLDKEGYFIGTNSNKYTLVSPPGLTATGNYVFASGSSSKTDWSKAPFWVKDDGTIYSTSGTIGNWIIKPYKLYSTGSKVTTEGSEGYEIAVMQTPYGDNTYVFAAGNSKKGLSGTTDEENINAAHSSYANCPFWVNRKGEIKSTAGTIGGWKITSTALYSGSSVTSTGSGAVAISNIDFTRTVAGASRSGLRIAIGDDFGVNNNGKIYARNANIGGTIYASGGTFSGDITIDGNLLLSSNGSIGMSTGGTGRIEINNGVFTYRGYHQFLGTTTYINHLSLDGLSVTAGQNYAETDSWGVYNLCKIGEIGGATNEVTISGVTLKFTRGIFTGTA